MRVIMGVAPSRHSVTDENGFAKPWCPSSLSGEKVQLLIGATPVTFANASDRFPGVKPRGGDRTPAKTAGYERLCGMVDAAPDDQPLDILLLGLAYWKEVADMAARLGRLRASRSNMPVAQAMNFMNQAGNRRARVFLFPHPRNWPLPQAMTTAAYRTSAKSALARQNIRRSRKSSQVLGDRDYEAVFQHFGM